MSTKARSIYSFTSSRADATLILVCYLCDFAIAANEVTIRQKSVDDVMLWTNGGKHQTKYQIVFAQVEVWSTVVF